MPHDDHGHAHEHGSAEGAVHEGGHHHHHPAPPDRFDTAFALGTVLNTGFVVAEVVYGLLANSMALLADAAHNVGDVLGLLLAWGAAVLSRRRPSRRHTYGLGRSSILASLINATVLLIGTGAIAAGAVERLIAPEPVAAVTVMAIAAIGIVVNGATALLFLRGRHADLNIRGAFLHMAADAGVSAGVVLSGVIILFTGWTILDPVISLGIAVAIILSSLGLMRDSADMALDAVPGAISHDAVKAHLRALPGVVDVHDLHIWALSTTKTALTAHLVRPADTADDAFLARVRDDMRRRFRIGHATIQLECGDRDHPCTLASDDVI